MSLNLFSIQDLNLPLGPGSGGTGTSTIFTTGSVIFVDGGGVYAQNNAQFFWDNVNFFHGIGTNTPAAPLHIVQPNALVEMRLDFFSNTNPFSMFRGNGTPTAITQALTGDVLGGYAGFGSNNSTGFNTGPSGRIRILAAENQVNNSRGGDIVFDTVIVGGLGITERMRLLNNGNLGIGLTAPGSKLTVQGTTSDSTANGLNVTNSGTTSILFVRNDSRVGILNTSPTQALDVIGNIQLQSNLLMVGSSSGTFTQAPAATVTSYQITWPGAQGAAGTTISNNGSGVLSWVAFSDSNTAQSTPSNPTGTTDLTGKMMGLAGAITPTSTGKVLINISGTSSNDTLLDGASMQIRTGTGTAPANGAALTGTAQGGKVRSNTAVSGELIPFALNAIVTGLTLNTAVWIDVGLAAITGGTASISDISISVHEL